MSIRQIPQPQKPESPNTVEQDEVMVPIKERVDEDVKDGAVGQD